MYTKYVMFEEMESAMLRTNIYFKDNIEWMNPYGLGWYPKISGIVFLLAVKDNQRAGSRYKEKSSTDKAKKGVCFHVLYRFIQEIFRYNENAEIHFRDKILDNDNWWTTIKQEYACDCEKEKSR